MKTFLAAENAAFYHITRLTTWENEIQQYGLMGDQLGRIFVCRTDDAGILYSIAISQLLRLNEEPNLVVLRLTQEANQFQLREIAIDHQSNEITMPLQNIIFRPSISLANIEYVRTVNMCVDELAMIANPSDFELSRQPIFRHALDMTYEEPSGRQYQIDGQETNGLWDFKKKYL